MNKEWSELNKRMQEQFRKVMEQSAELTEAGMESMSEVGKRAQNKWVFVSALAVFAAIMNSVKKGIGGQ